MGKEIVHNGLLWTYYVQYMRVFIEMFEDLRNGKSNSGAGVMNIRVSRLHFIDENWSYKV